MTAKMIERPSMTLVLNTLMIILEQQSRPCFLVGDQLIYGTVILDQTAMEKSELTPHILSLLALNAPATMALIDECQETSELRPYLHLKEVKIVSLSSDKQVAISEMTIRLSSIDGVFREGEETITQM